jgi:hypothetical protein
MFQRTALFLAIAVFTSCSPAVEEPRFDIRIRPNTVMSKDGVTEDPASITTARVVDSRLGRAVTPSMPGGVSRSAPPIVLEPSGATTSPIPS